MLPPLNHLREINILKPIPTCSWFFFFFHSSSDWKVLQNNLRAFVISSIYEVQNVTESQV